MVPSPNGAKLKNGNVKEETYAYMREQEPQAVFSLAMEGRNILLNADLKLFMLRRRRVGGKHR